MSEELNQMENHDDSVPSQQTTSSDKRESVYAWVVIVLVLLLIAGYFYYTFGIKDTSTPDTILATQEAQEAQEETNEQEVAVLTNEEITPGVPREYWSDAEVNLDIFDLMVLDQHGRILATPGAPKALYVNSMNDCMNECLNKWIPYEAEGEYTDGPTGTIYREDLGLFQYTWNGEQLYTYTGDSFLSITGPDFGNGWELARP